MCGRKVGGPGSPAESPGGEENSTEIFGKNVDEKKYFFGFFCFFCFFYYFLLNKNERKISMAKCGDRDGTDNYD